VASFCGTLIFMAFRHLEFGAHQKEGLFGGFCVYGLIRDI